MVDEVIAAYAAEKKDEKQRRRIKRFQVVKVNVRNRLISPGTEQRPICFLSIGEIYDVINTAHASSGHGGRDRMRHALKDQYANVTYDMILEFLKHCEACQSKKSSGFVVKPIIETGYLKRVQVDLIDMQSRPDGQFKWILVFQDERETGVYSASPQSKTQDTLYCCVCRTNLLT